MGRARNCSRESARPSMLRGNESARQDFTSSHHDSATTGADANGLASNEPSRRVSDGRRQDDDDEDATIELSNVSVKRPTDRRPPQAAVARLFPSALFRLLWNGRTFWCLQEVNINHKKEKTV